MPRILFDEFGKDQKQQLQDRLQSVFAAGFSRLRISCVSWLLLIELFELEISARKAGIQLGLSYPTTLKGFDILRGVIIESYRDPTKY